MKNLNVLFVQDSSPCIRNLKYAEALQQQGVRVHLLHRNNSPDQAYGRGNNFYASITKFRSRMFFLRTLARLLKERQIDLIHYHNQPDLLGARIIKARLGLPFVFDCHDFMSFKHRLNKRAREAERACNEDSDALIYPAAEYLNEAMKYYHMTPKRLVFGNYYPASLLLDPVDFQPKLSARDGRLHLVYQGRLAEKKSDHRYLAGALRSFDPDRYVVHVFPSNRKDFQEYRAIKSVVMHDKLPYARLISQLSAMDYGLVMFQDSIARKLPAVRFAFGNTTFDYLCAGLPVLVQDSLDEVRSFVSQHKVGWLLSGLADLPLPGSEAHHELVKQVLSIRGNFSMERQIGKVLELYQTLTEAPDA